MKPPVLSRPWRQQYPYLSDLLLTAGIGVVVGLLMYLMRGRNFWIGMVYAMLISLCIGTSIGLLQRAVCRGLLRRNPQGPQHERLKANWPGWPWMAPCVLLGAVIGHEAGSTLAAALLGHAPSGLFSGDARQLLFAGGFTLLMSVAATLFFYSRERLHDLELERAAVQRQAAEAQLTALQAQLEPHMLFNTLAHLRALIKLRPDEAQAMLDELIAYLRATLQASRRPLHPLETEFARLADYLKLMQRRMGARLQVELDLPPELAAVAVPPLLLQPLVENAIQHGLEPHVAGGLLRVSARREGESLLLRVEDNGAGLGARPSSGTGFGTAQVRERLATQYGQAASLQLEDAAPGTRSLVRIPA
jgi:Histidine kinase